MSAAVFFLVFASFAAGAASATASQDSSTAASGMPPEGYAAVKLQWTGPVVAGGANVTLEGTIEDIADQLDPGLLLLPVAPTPATAQRAWTTDLCKAGLAGPARAVAVDQAVAKLRRTSGDCGLPGGLAVCGLLSCERGSAVRWCNNNGGYASWRCADLATYVESLRAHCTLTDDGRLRGTGRWVWGQSFDSRNFVSCIACFSAHFLDADHACMHELIRDIVIRQNVMVGLEECPSPDH
ncbi:hypothetical protein F4780DRAFT_774852 [Xylariomycetidae sp. FL0641]|nr:hypothetical protein F4780DRAFT_774852 [Xylariomycetidae sp. FL0641]